MKLFTQKRGDSDDGEREAINEPLFIVRHPQKARELIQMGARPKKYRHIKEADLCLALIGVDGCLSLLRSMKKSLEIIACTEVEQLSAEDVELRSQTVVDVIAMVQRVGSALSDSR